jgi:hypothetical protein
LIQDIDESKDKRPISREDRGGRGYLGVEGNEVLPSTVLLFGALAAVSNRAWAT